MTMLFDNIVLLEGSQRARALERRF